MTAVLIREARLRTRVSFEAGMHQTWTENAIFLGRPTSGWASRESMADFGRVGSRVRRRRGRPHLSHERRSSFARLSGRPGDQRTYRRRPPLPGWPILSRLTSWAAPAGRARSSAFIGDGNNVARWLAHGVRHGRACGSPWPREEIPISTPIAPASAQAGEVPELELRS